MSDPQDSSSAIADEELKKLREERKKAKDAAKAAKAAKAKAKQQQRAAVEKKPAENDTEDGEKGKKKEKTIRLKDSSFVNTTPVGEKKALGELARAYDPPAVEAAWYSWWEKQGFFRPEYFAERDAAAGRTEPRDTFVMVIPPPNVTGSLHIGHALTESIEDAVARWHRQHGRRVLWVPGTDHAGIATQSVVERMLLKREKLTKHDLGREAFVERVWSWKEEYSHRITGQLRRLGGSYDWSRERFTLDPAMSAAVTEAFVRFHESGLIYRANRLVNWSCALRTALSDLECDDLELDGPSELSVPGHPAGAKYPFGRLWQFAYRVVGSDEEVVVATTRPETMLGDTAVAVHPEDPRYTHLHGKTLQHPFLPRTLPIVCDAVLVDMAFGTGAVKITPAHDPNDYEVGKRHGLEFVTVFTEGGAMDANTGEFAGLLRFEARNRVIARLTELGLYRGEVPNKMRLQLCSRSGDIIEPFLKPQWYVDTTTMAARSAEAVRSGALRIVPERHTKQWFHYMDNPQPWCVSRQLWWGHRIPAYRVVGAGDDMWVVARSAAEAEEKARALAGGAAFTLEQDEDVLDTWFSSGLFPLSVMGWPSATADLAAYFPTTLLETGWDILFFWVARMVMMSLQLTDTLPFREVLLHAMVRDAHGRKMSKTLGNVVDPLDVIEGITLEQLHAKLLTGNLRDDEIERAREGQRQDFPNGISECGTDALRFALLAYSGQGKDINLDINRVVAYRNFCNKIWNAFKLASSFVTAAAPAGFVAAPEQRMDAWVLSRLNGAVAAAAHGFETYDFGEAANALYAFWLYDFCDLYLESIKPTMRGGSAAAQDSVRATLATVLDTFLRALHPFMPFLTEELWQRLPREAGDDTPSVCVAPYPHALRARAAPALEAEVAQVRGWINAVRSLLTSYNINTRSTKPQVTVSVQDDATAPTAAAFAEALGTLTNCAITVAGRVDVPRGTATALPDHAVALYLHLAGLVDPAKEIARLQKKEEQVTKLLSDLQARQALPDYARVPESVQTSDRERVQNWTDELAATRTALVTFRELVSE